MISPEMKNGQPEVKMTISPDAETMEKEGWTYDGN
jgi:hypothetical protein